MYLMTFIHIAQSGKFERILIMVAQAIFYNAFFFTYLLAPRTAHRIVGYLEEEAMISYTQYLNEIDGAKIEDVPAPQIAIDYWGLPNSATLRDVVIDVRADEAEHHDTNYGFADQLASG